MPCFSNDQEVGRDLELEAKQPSNCSREPIQYLIMEYVRIEIYFEKMTNQVRRHYPEIVPVICKIVTVLRPQRSISVQFQEYVPYVDSWAISDKYSFCLKV